MNDTSFIVLLAKEVLRNEIAAYKGIYHPEEESRPTDRPCSRRDAQPNLPASSPSLPPSSCPFLTSRVSPTPPNPSAAGKNANGGAPPTGRSRAYHGLTRSSSCQDPSTGFTACRYSVDELQTGVYQSCIFTSSVCPALSFVSKCTQLNKLM